jgi:hypothetical protein
MAAIKINAENPFLKDVELLVDECVSLNRDMVIEVLKKSQGYDNGFIIETFVYKIAAGLFQNKTAEEWIELVSGGAIFEVKDMLMNAFLSDQDIVKTLRKQG